MAGSGRNSGGGGVTLHKTKGVNPHLTYCPRCGGDGRDILLLGANDKKFTCDHCEVVSYGSRKCLNTKCIANQTRTGTGKVEVIGDREKLPGGLCESCENEVAEHKRLVEAGGVYWKCADCKQSGVIKPGARLAAVVRKQLGVEAPAPCGCEFTASDCPACGPNKAV